MFHNNYSSDARARNSVPHAKLGIYTVAGVILGLLMPFLVDYALFGTPMPCKTVQVYEDGSSIQSCKVGV